MSISQLNSLRKIKFGTKMRTPHLAALMLFVFFFFFTLCHETSCSTDLDSENDRLQKLIKSQRTWSSIRDRSWVRMNSKNGFSEVYVGDQYGLMEADKIHTLPGQPQGVAFDQYAGYVTVDPKAGRALFYYFVESPQDASTKPLVLWLNGGPGCSSLGGGAMVELGPFRVNSDGRTLYANDYAWNNVANIIFLESPAGVGFSYSNTTSDYQHTGDKRTADDSYAFLINWLERFPEYKKRDFYITGESYAGHYVPELADTILTNNNNSNNTVINLKGIAIGNGYIDGNMNTKANYDYYWTHALISDEAHQAVQSKCDFSSPSYSVECNDAMSVADSELGRIDHYDIYAPRCHLSGARSITTHLVKEVDPCAGNYVSTYLNLPEVQRALHANVTGLPYPWTVCSQFVGWSDWTDGPVSMLPTIKKLIDSGIRLWMYSGDVDSVCSVTSTKYSISTLKLDIESSWRPWYTNNQVGGYVVGYKGLAFATVRGAGHMVPSTQPERALAMITSFLHGELPPTA